MAYSKIKEIETCLWGKYKVHIHANDDVNIIVGINGSGKTTLLNILSGKEGYDNGTSSFRRDLRVGFLEQDPQ